ncbi:MAG: hypothetical protein R3Y28_06410 [Candidatus Gastranaerophilales bacterium]
MKNEYIIHKENLRTLIKILTTLDNKTLTQLKVLINHKYNKCDSLENMANKLRNNTFRVTELMEVMDILGYDLLVRKK